MQTAEHSKGTEEAALRLSAGLGYQPPEYIECEKCGKKLGISPNTKGAFSYQGCDCHIPEWKCLEDV